MPAIKIGILGQGKPNAAADSVLYTVPVNRQAVLSTIAVANTSSVEDNIRVHVVKSAAGVAVENAICYGTIIAENAHYGITEGITLGPGEFISVRSMNGSVAFSLFGEESDVPS